MPERTPDLVQPVIGYRVWNVVGPPDAERLGSHVLRQTQWKPGVNEARCRGGEFAKVQADHLESPLNASHSAPQKNCTCGFYALPSIYKMDGDNVIVGAIAAWGKIQVHRDGIRAEKAMIVALAITDDLAWNPNRRRLLERLAATYRCPAVPMCDLPDEARKHGIEMPTELLPEPPDPAAIELVMPPIQFASGGTLRAFGLPAKPPKPSKLTKPKRPQRLVTWAACVNAIYLPLAVPVGFVVTGEGAQMAGLVAAAITGVLGALPLYRLALRTRCVWQALMFTNRDYHGVVWNASENRGREDLEAGDRCPECGWRLK